LPDGVLIATWSSLAHPGALPFTGHDSRAWPLPELSDTEKETVLKLYYDATTAVGVASGPDSLWWYTWTSSRDRFHSRILADMEVLARLTKAFEQGLPPRLALQCPDPYLAAAIKNLAKRNEVDVQVSIGARLLWLRQRIRMWAAPLVSGIRTCQGALAKKRRIGRRDVTLPAVAGTGDRTLIVTWLKEENLADGGSSTGTFFGRLPEFIKESKGTVVLFGDLLDVPDKSSVKGQVDPSLPIISASDFQGKRVAIGCLIRGLLSSIRIPKGLGAENANLTSLIKRDIHNNRGMVVSGLIFESALSRLCRLYQPTQIIHSCENNPWERACARVARTMTTPPQVTGFMHCAVLLSHPKIIITESEKQVRPRPKKLVCTGPKAREIMIHRGGHSPEEVAAGCALRHEYLWEMRPRERAKRKVQKILVALDGLPTMPGLVRFILDALDGEPSYQTVLRPHPIDTPETVMANAGIPMSALKTIKFSDNPSLAEDLDEADLLIYRGSTVAIEAGFLGIPLIHLDPQNLLNNDPLFEVTSLKDVVCKSDELVTNIQRFSAMDNTEYLRQRDELARYSDQYFVKPTKELAKVFVEREPEVSRL